jgi:hypothetical protein
MTGEPLDGQTEPTAERNATGSLAAISTVGGPRRPRCISVDEVARRACRHRPGLQRTDLLRAGGAYYVRCPWSTPWDGCARS